MKVVPILFPYPCRGEPAPYLCTFLRSINTALPGSAYFIVDRACLDWDRFKDRWEFEPWNQRFHEYRIDESLKPSRIEFLDESLFEPLVRQHVTPIRAWRFLILERYQPLEDTLKAALDRAEAALGGIDCVLTWLNVASLRHVCAARGIPLVHNEHGPLRKPTWRHTAYYDLAGVNGQTNSFRDYATFCAEFMDRDLWPSLDSLRNALLSARQPSTPESPPPYPCGVATQLEEDSNLIAFGNGFSSLEVVRHCQRRFGSDHVLARIHPVGMSLVRGHIDTSADAIRFIHLCNEIHTINSSVAAEALLFGKPVITYGDTPLRVAMRPLPEGNGMVWTSVGAESAPRALCFFFLSYLMPYSLVFDPDYIRWRLRQPTHLERMVVHMRQYSGMPARYDSPPRSQLLAEFQDLLDRLGEDGGNAIAQPATPSATALIFEGAPSLYRQLDEHNALQREHDMLKNERDALLNERNSLSEERDALLRSRSWKLTAPLRWLDARIRGQ